MMKIFLSLLLSITLWANIGNVMVIKGSAEVQRSGGNIAATMGMIVLEGDAIVTKVKTRVQIMLKDETVVTVGSSSHFSFDEYSFDGTKKSKLQMSATRGFFRSVTGKLGKVAPKRFKIKTANATIGIRGTDISANINEGQETIRCHSGAISVEFEGAVSDVDAGTMILLKPDTPPVIKEIPKGAAEDGEDSEESESDEEESEDSEESESDEEEGEESEESQSSDDQSSDDSNENSQTPDSNDEMSNDSRESGSLEDIVETEIESVEISTEDIADVTQTVDEPYIAPIEIEKPIEDIVEPFEMTPSTQDREVQY